MKTMSSQSSPAGLVSAPPVFFLQEDAPEDMSTFVILDAAERLVGFNTILGLNALVQCGGCILLPEKSEQN